jgi:tetratricopeptide (TPR) repeat protein
VKSRRGTEAVCRLIAIATTALLTAAPLGAQTESGQDKVSPASSPRPRGLTAEARSKIAELDKQIVRFRDQGQFAEAMAPAREVLEIRTRLQGASHVQTVAARDWLGQIEEMAKLTEEGQRALGSSYAQEYRAIALERKAAYREAERIHRAVIETYRRWVGERHRSTAAIYNNLAANLGEQGRYPEGEALYRKALEIWREALGEDHPNTSRAYNNLGLNLDYQGKSAEATPLLRKALATWRKVLGEDHPDTATACNNLALSLEHQARYAEAMPLYREALEIRRKVLGEAHRDTAGSYSNLAVLLDRRGQHADAEPLHRKAREAWRKALGEAHPDAARGDHNLAINLEYQGRFADATPLFQNALATWRRVLGEDHPDTAQAYSSLAVNLDHLSRHAEALPLHQKSQEIRRKISGEAHPGTAEAYSKLAVNLDRQGRFADAEPLYRKAVDVRRKVLGEDHPDTGRAWNDLAVSLELQGRRDEAEPLYRNALRVFRKALGEDHPDTAAAYYNLGFTLYALGKVSEATQNWTAAVRSFERGRLAMSRSGLGRSQAERIDPLPALAIAKASAGQAREAWRLWESSLGRGLLDDLSARRLRPLTPAERDQETGLLGKIQQLDEQIGGLIQSGNASAQAHVRLDHFHQQRDLLRGRLDDLEQSIEAEHGAFGGKRASLEEVQAALPPDTALVGWVDVRTRNREVSLHWACLVAAQGDPTWVRVPGSGPEGAWTEADDRRTDQLRAALLGPGLVPGPIWRSLAAQVAGQRLAPLMPGLGRFRRLIVLPSADLAGIPADVLLAAWPKGPTPTPVVSHAPSATIFAQLVREGADRPRATKLLAVGDPLYDEDAPPASAARPGEGVLITQVEFPKGMKGPIEPNDVLLTYDGQEILDVKQFKKALGEIKAKRKALPAGQSFKPSVTLLRAGKTRSFVLAPHFSKITYKTWRGAAPPSAKELMPLASRLPGTRREVLAISALFPRGAVTTLLGARATEAEVGRLAGSGELASYRYLHFATHGSVYPNVAMSSALILGPSDGTETASDGRITAEQILSTWTLDADLVVLSACETGVGKRAGGEGYLGFAQALFIKGARSLVLSEWPVSDAATSLLMVRFYQNLLGKRPGLSRPMPKAEALDEAKRWLRNLSPGEAAAELNRLDESTPVTIPTPTAPAGARPFDHPQFWAAFILVGDPD